MNGRVARDIRVEAKALLAGADFKPLPPHLESWTDKRGNAHYRAHAGTKRRLIKALKRAR